MIPDRNKTLSTRQITAVVVAWLDEHGFKPVETEVLVAESWQSDIAGLIDCTEGEAIYLRLAPRKPTNWRTSDGYREKREAFVNAYKALPSPLTALVEVKTSLSDLNGDSKWKRASPTDLRYVAMPLKLLERALAIVPHSWGLMTVTDSGVKIHRYAGLESDITVEQRFRVAYNVGIRRDHRTRHKVLRESLKSARVVHNREVVTPDRWSRIVRAMLDICDGGQDFRKEMTLEQVLAWHRIGKLPEWLIERLRNDLWGISKGAVELQAEENAA